MKIINKNDNKIVMYGKDLKACIEWVDKQDSKQEYYFAEEEIVKVPFFSLLAKGEIIGEILQKGFENGLKSAEENLENFLDTSKNNIFVFKKEGERKEKIAHLIVDMNSVPHNEKLNFILKKLGENANLPIKAFRINHKSKSGERQINIYL